MGTQQEKATAQPIDRLRDKVKRNLVPLLERYQHRLTWQVWAAILVVVFGSIGFTATTLLLKSPSSSSCPKIFWPIASASMRFYCAQLEADRHTVEGLLKAIALVEALPTDHPLRPQINVEVEQWAKEILDLAEKEFQSGNLEQAIAIAHKIPENVAARDDIEKQIKEWQAVWTEGEKIVADVEHELRESNWNQAFRLAVQLLNLGNEYWATTRYNETVQTIYLAREESSKLDKAFALFHRGGIDNWLKAVEEAQKIKTESYAYKEAQNLIGKVKEKLQNYAQQLLDNKQWQDLKAIVQRIPENLLLKEDLTDWESLANAGIDAGMDTVEGLQAAILSAEQIESSRPLYKTAQDMIRRWKLESEDVVRLNEARDLAQSGNIKDLSDAIAKAQQIPSANPRYGEAQREIGGWQRQIQTIEDRPILDQAREMALQGDGNSLQAAIAQAGLISSNRALYQEAQIEIRQWRNQIERQEDQPLLDQALALANVGDYTAAIDTAQQILQNRALYTEARTNIRQWRRELQAQQNLQQAYQIAEDKSADALLRAIGILNNIPASSQVGSQRLEALDRWSYQILAIATDRANLGLYDEAIGLVKRIPSDSSAYSTARSQVKIWQQMLQPAPVSSPTTPESEVTTPSTQ